LKQGDLRRQRNVCDDEQVHMPEGSSRWGSNAKTAGLASCRLDAQSPDILSMGLIYKIS